MSAAVEPLWWCNDCGEPNRPEWIKCHNCDHTSRYYADEEHEKQCENCGWWHGQHVLKSTDCGSFIGVGHCPEGGTMFAPTYD